MKPEIMLSVCLPWICFCGKDGCPNGTLDHVLDHPDDARCQCGVLSNSEWVAAIPEQTEGTEGFDLFGYLSEVHGVPHGDRELAIGQRQA